MLTNVAHQWEWHTPPLQTEDGDIPGDTVVRDLPANAGDTAPVPGLEKSTRHRATKPLSRNYWLHALEPTS